MWGDARQVMWGTPGKLLNVKSGMFYAGCFHSDETADVQNGRFMIFLAGARVLAGARS